MLGVLAIVLAVLAAVLVTGWLTFTVTRLDRLHARVDAAQASLDAQLVRRAAALQHVAEAPDSGVADTLRPRYAAIAQHALASGAQQRETAENAVGRAVAELVHLDGPVHADVLAEVREAAARVRIARRFYNDAVRDTRALRARRMPRLLHMAGRRELPQFFDIDDSLPDARPAGASSDLPRPTPTRTLEEEES